MNVDRLVALITQVIGIPLAVFLNALPEGRVAYLWAGLASSS